MNRCDSAEEIVKKQAIALGERIREAKEREEKRISFLENATSVDRRKELERRYNSERIADQEAIERLVSDLERVKHFAASGGFQNLERKRVTGASEIKTMEVDRFHSPAVFLKEETENKLKRGNNRHSSTPFNIAVEEKKVNYNHHKIFDFDNLHLQLKLLIEKKEILQKLATVAKKELNIQSTEGTHRSTSRLVDDSRSIISSSYTARTDASYATFATSRNETPRNGATQDYGRHYNRGIAFSSGNGNRQLIQIPKLHL